MCTGKISLPGVSPLLFHTPKRHFQLSAASGSADIPAACFISFSQIYIDVQFVRCALFSSSPSVKRSITGLRVSQDGARCWRRRLFMTVTRHQSRGDTRFPARASPRRTKSKRFPECGASCQRRLPPLKTEIYFFLFFCFFPQKFKDDNEWDLKCGNGSGGVTGGRGEGEGFAKGEKGGRRYQPGAHDLAS